MGRTDASKPRSASWPRHHSAALHAVGGMRRLRADRFDAQQVEQVGARRRQPGIDMIQNRGDDRLSWDRHETLPDRRCIISPSHETRHPVGRQFPPRGKPDGSTPVTDVARGQPAA